MATAGRDVCLWGIRLSPIIETQIGDPNTRMGGHNTERRESKNVDPNRSKKLGRCGCAPTANARAMDARELRRHAVARPRSPHARRWTSVPGGDPDTRSWRSGTWGRTWSYGGALLPDVGASGYDGTANEDERLGCAEGAAFVGRRRDAS